jgi:surface antigen
MKRFLAVSVAVLGLGLVADQAAEASRYKMFQSMPDLAKADIDLLTQSARSGLDSQPEGSSVTWSNDKSGLRGEVTLLRLYQRQGQDCRQILHQIWTRHGAHDWAVSRICLQSDGSWKIPPD